MAKRGRKPKDGQNYFSEREESAVLEYIQSDNPERKNVIYNEVLRPALNTMVESIIRRYNLYLPNEEFDDTFNDTLSFLDTKMDKFKKGRISKKTGKPVKAYSYYQTIVKNYLLGRLKKNSKSLMRFPSYSEAYREIADNIRYSDEVSRSKIIANDIVDRLSEKIKKMIDDPVTYLLKPSEIILAKALLNLLENWDYVLSTDGSIKLRKNAVLFFLREQTGFDTKGVRDNLKKFKQEFLAIRQAVIDED